MKEPTEGPFQPDLSFTGHAPEEARAVAQTYATVVGFVALLLPFAVPLVAFRTGETCVRDSLSHYYYTAWGGNLFMVGLALVAGVLIHYRSDNPREAWLATFAGLMLVVIAFVPAAGLGCNPAEEGATARIVVEMTPGGAPDALIPMIEPELGTERDYDVALGRGPVGTGTIHVAAAGVLLLILARLCLSAFTRIKDGDMRDGRVKKRKRLRNLIYRLCGLVILACLVALVVYAAIQFAGGAIEPLARLEARWTEENATYWLEAVALVAFGIAWLTKGRFGVGFLDT